jgi:hypothetical protein
MEGINLKKVVVFLIHAFIGWALCGAIMFIGMEITTEQNALIAHAVGAPIIFAAISLVYFNKFNYTSPIQTAIGFVAFVIFMDATVVAMLIEKSFEMFASLLGTWIPFGLLFLATYITGSLVVKPAGKMVDSPSG